MVQESLIDQDSCRKLVAAEKVSISNFYKRDCGGVVNIQEIDGSIPYRYSSIIAFRTAGARRAANAAIPKFAVN